MKGSWIFILAMVLPSSLWASDDLVLVENGQPRAEIIIADRPARMARMAAPHELRETIEKISGARLPIVTAPTGKAVKVFVGASTHNPITADGLRYGAYRIASGRIGWPLLAMIPILSLPSLCPQQQ